VSEELTNRVAKLGIRLYQGTFDEDYVIARWWDKLTNSGEINRFAAQSAQPLSGFFSMFQAPNMLSYTLHDSGEIESAYWVRPVPTSPYAVFLSAWKDPSCRATKRHAQVGSTVHELLFTMGKLTIMGITKQVSLLKLLKDMGYDILGPIPNLCDQDKGWLCVLTEEKFKQGKLYLTVQRTLSAKEQLHNRRNVADVRYASPHVHALQ